jgi:murein DD-endopeptidase MepM/ murein hydrolase activator NlpD
MPLHLADRVLTVAVTATLTSAAWIVLGSTYLPGKDAELAQNDVQPAQAMPASRPTPAPAAGKPSAALSIPVAGIAASQLTDTFNQTRGGTRRHEALDIMAPAGTRVIAAAPGTVEKLFLSDAGGNTIYVRSPDRRMIYYYAHLQAYARGLKEGMAVEQGQELGTVGSTGNANPAAPHLHFAMMRTAPDSRWWEPATPINPFPLLAVTR